MDFTNFVYLFKMIVCCLDIYPEQLCHFLLGKSESIADK